MGVVLAALFGLVVLAAVGAGVYLVGAQAVKRSTDRSLQVVPGTELDVPSNWFGSHEAEARLHRRLRDAVAALRSAAGSDLTLASTLTQIEHHAIRLDQHLINVSRLPAASRSAQIGELEGSIAALEELTTQAITGSSGLGTGAITADLQRLSADLQALDAAKAEVEEIDRRHLGEA